MTPSRTIRVLLVEDDEDDYILTRDLFGAVEYASERGAGLVRQILTFARKTDATFQEVDVNALVEELKNMLSGTFPKTINFCLRLERSLPAITADPIQLHQSLLNLCVNARDAMPQGGLLTIATGLEGERHGRPAETEGKAARLCIAVSDTGVGMPEAVQKRVFEPFFTTKARGKGSGLGLAVLYGVVNSHGGQVEVESQPGAGTTFRIYLPVQSRPAVHVAPVRASDDPVPGGTETILLAEDEFLLLDLLKVLLEEKGYRVIAAADGLAAVELFQRHRAEIDLVVLDMGLPKLGGWEAFLKTKEADENVCAVLVSGYLEPDLKERMVKAGAKEFIQKPYLPSDLMLCLRQVLDGKQTASAR